MFWVLTSSLDSFIAKSGFIWKTSCLVTTNLPYQFGGAFNLHPIYVSGKSTPNNNDNDIKAYETLSIITLNR